MVTTIANESVAPMPGEGAKRACGAGAEGKGLWWRQFLDYADLRFRLASFFVKRGLGLAEPRTLDPALLDKGLTLVLPGIEAESIFTYGMCDGLLDGGVLGAIRVFNWGLPLPGGYLANLTWVERNRRRAAEIAAEVVAYQDAYPGRPAHLVAQSGGCGVAVFAAEAMPSGRMMDGVALCGPAISPGYDLTRALRKTRKGILSAYSCRDRFVLGWGTRLFGTTDRQFCAAAGSVGFAVPAGLDEEGRRLYGEKLLQIGWTRAMAEECEHWGGHLSWGCELFMAKKIAPWVRGG